MDDDEVKEILLGIHSKLDQIDGKTTLNARAIRDELIKVVNDLVEGKPLVGQIYLVVDGKLTQTELAEELKKFGLSPKPMAITRAIDAAKEIGLLALVETDTPGKVYRRDPTTNSILRLTRKIPDWLRAQGETVPLAPQRKRKAKRADG